MGYSLILEKSREVLDWKNKHGQCVFPYGGVFDLSGDFFIKAFTENGVVVSNGSQLARVSNEELNSGVARFNEQGSVKFIRQNARKCYELENFIV